LGTDIGTGFNLSSALVSAFDCFIAAAVAWRISRQNIWITLLAPVLMEGASTGATAYLWFTEPALNPNEADDIFSGLDNSDNHSSLLKLIHDHCRYEVVPPGAWSWIGSFHSTTVGLFLVLFFVWSLTEILRRKVTNWPWICLGTIPLMTTVSSTWALPFEVLLFLCSMGQICCYGFFPRNFRLVLLAWGMATALMLPTITEYLTGSFVASFDWTGADCRIRLAEFLILWWPIYLPFLALLFAWKKLPPAVKTVLIALPTAYWGMDHITVANRYDWVGKFGSYIYSTGWVVLLPALYVRRAIVFRLLLVLLVASSLFSFWAWAGFFYRTDDWGDILRLEGTGSYRWDPVLSTLLANLSRVHGKTILTGKTEGGESPVLAAFTGNRIFVTWWSDTDAIKVGSPAPHIAKQAGQEVNDFYDGKCENPLLFLRTHDISAVVIFPEDTVRTSVIVSLKRNLAPYYEYVDCRGSDGPNAGIFFYHPELAKWPAQILLHPPHPKPPVITSVLAVSGLAGFKFSYNIIANNTPTTYGAANLPAGLTIDTDTGVITGIPIEAKTSTVTLSSSNAGGTGAVKLTLTVRGTDGLSVLNGLTAWLRADVGVQLDGSEAISDWSDLTPHANDAQQDNSGLRPSVSTTTINGQSAIHFDGTTTFLDLPPCVPDDFSIFVVFRSTKSTGNGGQWFYGAGIVDAETSGVVNDFGLSLDANGEVLTGVGNPDTSIVSLHGGYNDGNPHLAAFTRTEATGVFTQHVDSILQGIIAGNTSTLLAPPRITIGATQTLANYFNGDIAEILIYDRVLSTSEEQQIESYLMKKYGISPPIAAADTPHSTNSKSLPALSSPH
jgi:hypothetical protein